MKQPVKISRCQRCKKAVRVAAVEMLDKKGKNTFAKEAFQHNLSIETIPLEVYKALDPEMNFCNCIIGNNEEFSAKLYLVLSRPPEPENGLIDWEYYELETSFTVHTLKMEFLPEIWHFEKEVEKAFDGYTAGASPSWKIKFFRNGIFYKDYTIKLFNESGTKPDKFTEDRFANDLQLLSNIHLYEGGPTFQEIINSTKKETYVPR